jgi:hypothetical protein
MASVAGWAHPRPADAAVAAERQAAHADEREHDAARDPAARQLREVLPAVALISAKRAAQSGRHRSSVCEPPSLCHWVDLMVQLGSLQQPRRAALVGHGFVNGRNWSTIMI